VPRRKKRNLTLEESLKIISPLVDKEPLLGFKNHRKHSIRDNTYRFTVELLSLEFLISLMEHKQVKNVFFNASFPPPGGSIDSISLRYKVYVEYYSV